MCACGVSVGGGVVFFYLLAQSPEGRRGKGQREEERDSTCHK